jgi:phage tail sheath gpL-like
VGLTDIGTQRTPGRPTEITFGPNLSLPASIQPIVLIGHRGASGAASGSSGIANYQAVTISNVASIAGASAEAIADFGSGSELAKMVIAAVTALVEQDTVFPPMVAIPLAQVDTDWGNGTNQALTTLDKITAGVVISCYDAQLSQTNFNALITECKSMSGPQRVENQQFGTTAVGATMNVASPSSLVKYDTQNAVAFFLRDQSGLNPDTPATLAARCGALIQANDVPYLPLNNVVVGGATPPTNDSDNLTIGAGLESEVTLGQGWSPLKVTPTEAVAFVRTVTTRLTSDGTTPVNSYFDFQDFQVLYFFRESVYDREQQPDFANVKASVQTAKALKAAIIAIMDEFEADGMFQAVAQLAAQVQVVRNSSSRDRFDCLWPVNVIPGLAVIANNIQAGTQFDTFTV